MLEKLRIQRFKSWRDTGAIRLAPITVFFGANSSGKTSIGQLLLLLKQTSESPDRTQVLHPGDDRTPVELGAFYDMVHGHDLDSSIELELSWSPREPIEIRDAIGQRIETAESLSFAVTVDLLRNGVTNGSTDGRVSVVEMKYTAGSISVGLRRESPGQYQLIDEGFEAARQQKRPPKPGAPVRFNGFPDWVQAAYKNVGFVDDLTLALQQFFQRFYYLGPLREYPARTYIWSGEAPESVGWRGEQAIPAILAAQDRRINFAKGERTQAFPTLVSRQLEALGLSSRFEIQQVGEGRREYDVLVKTKSSANRVNLKDVGFGVSQVLPVVVQAFYAPPQSVQLFEQPEIHLHPAVQADLADVFISAIQAREHRQPRSNQFIIESHSEHFLRRLQRRIAEGRLSTEQVALYFCRAGRAGATLEELVVDEAGDITNWPEHFFGDEMGELIAKTRAAMKNQPATDG